MTPLSLSIVVCCHNGESHLDACLRGLVDQELSGDDYEIIVVDNASTDGTRGIMEGFAAEHPNVRCLSEPVPGKSRASNAAILASRAGHIAFTDDDVVVPRDWAARILAAFRTKSPAPSAVVGCVDARFEAEPPRWLAALLEGDDAARRLRGASFLGDGRDLYVVYGANVAYEKAALVAVGGFSEEWGPVAGNLRCGAEDTELLVRVGRAFPRVWFDPELRIEHVEVPGSMRLGYRLWRKHLEGIAVSRLEGTALVSRRSLATAARLARHLLSRGPQRDLQLASSEPATRQREYDATTRGVFLLMRVVALLGRLRGARLKPEAARAAGRGSLSPLQ